MGDGIFFPADGYTATAKIEEVKGIHAEAVIQYRPALYQEREEWRVTASNSTGERKAKLDIATVKKHVVTINGKPVPAERIPQIRPLLLQKIIDRIMGYDPEDETLDIKN